MLICIYTYTYTYINICTCIYIYTYIYIHVYVYAHTYQTHAEFRDAGGSGEGMPLFETCAPHSGWSGHYLSTV